ncbi:MAG: site-specific DNA-methyltransferase [Candidatus Aminicenantes bacterium]|nr:site-specific DNA-methyltransferase [Candidatus Aminicenantes bacterium]
MAKKKTDKTVETIRHKDATRKHIPTAEFQSVLRKEEQNPIRTAYERRNRDLDPQLVWRGKDEQDWSDLVVEAPPLYIQEKVHPKVLIDDLKKQTEEQEQGGQFSQQDLFADFNGLPDGAVSTEFYQHDANWSNRMILGDSLQVMASLAEREGLQGKVQCIYLDPPYGIKFNSNFQWSTTSRDVKDGNPEHISREPEQVKAFRDTWRDGIHSYLTYLRDRLTVARDLLTESGSIFVQIGDENVHRVRALMDEVFGEQNYLSTISYRTTGGFATKGLSRIGDNILWYSKSFEKVKLRQLFEAKDFKEDHNYKMLEDESYKNWPMTIDQQNGFVPLPDRIRIFRFSDATGQGSPKEETPFEINGKVYYPHRNTHWKANYPAGMARLQKSNRLSASGRTISYKRYFDDYLCKPINSTWLDTGISGFASQKMYVVETLPDVVQRCILMATDPGDLVLDPTCGSGTTAYVAEQWGRRWITIDTSRVALALARARIMGARFPFYLLDDSREGQIKEAEISQKTPSQSPTYGNIRQGFVYQRVPHITLKAIANNTEIDVTWEKFQQSLEPLRTQLNQLLNKSRQEWEIPREAAEDWPEEAKKIHSQWWQLRIQRQKEIDNSIAAKADYEYLYDKPYEDKKKVRVAGPFTVESLSPHRVLGVDENDDLIDPKNALGGETGSETEFVKMIIEHLKTSGVQQAHKEDKINFDTIMPWPGKYICAEGRYTQGKEENITVKRAAIFIGPEFGTVSRPDLVAAAREAGDGDFDTLITCAFNYDAPSSDFDKLGRIPVLKARMNADLHMADDLKNTGKGNLFVIFGEPDIDILDAENNQIIVKVNGVDVFHPNSGEVRSDGAEGIACWFIDTDYNEESFFVRHAYFLGANDPYKALKTTLKSEINKDAWDSLHSDVSRPFDKPGSGRIAVKVINHLGDEVMKVFKVP